MNPLAEPIQRALDALRALSAIDGELYRLDTELHDEPAALAAATKDRDRQRQAAQQAEHEAAAESSQQRTLEAELAEVERRGKRARDRLAVLTTAQQIASTEREVEDLKGQASELESKVLASMERVEGAETRGRTHRRLEAEIGGLLAAREAKWHARSPVAQAERATWASRRAETVVLIPTDILRMYTIGLGDKRFSPPSGLCVVDGATCSTCHTRSPPLWLQESRQRRAIHACEGCRRILLVEPLALTT